jgi:hypothetical protein
LVDRLSAMHRRHVALLGQIGLLDGDLQGVSVALRGLEQFLAAASVDAVHAAQSIA